MNSRSEAQGAGPTETVLELDDEPSFRRALQLLLTIANQRGIEISNQSWKCVSQETSHTWDVEITPVEPERAEQS